MNQSLWGLNQRSLVMSALIAGVGMGLLSSIPLVACVNCLLLAWVWGGAIAAVSIYRRYENGVFLNNTQGAVIGAAAGIVGAIIAGIASLLLSSVSVAAMESLRAYAGESGVDVPGFVFGAGANIVGTLINLVLFAVVGAIGGLIATALIWKAPVAAVPPPPPYNPPPPGSEM
jgi:hypothetical protein